MIEEAKNWYVVYTRPRWEKKTAGLLAKSGIENYCPLHKVTRQWSDRKKTVELPLFTSYVFIHAQKAQHSYIKDTDGVINFVYWLGRPAIIKDEEIEIIKGFLSTHENVRTVHMELRERDTVQVLVGPLSTMEGEVVGFGNRTVRVALPSLGYVLMAEVEKMNIKFISRYSELDGLLID